MTLTPAPLGGLSLSASMVPMPLIEGKWLHVLGGAMVWDSLAIADVVGLRQALGIFGTTVPPNPSDGDIWIYPVDMTNGVMWMFRYRAGSPSAYKWEYVGGSDVLALLATAETLTTSATWSELATVGPTVTVPRAGDYTAEGGASVYHTIVGTQMAIGVAVGATAPTPFASLLTQATGIASKVAPDPALFTGMAVGNDLRLRYFMNAAGTGTFSRRWLKVRPIRVS